MTIAFLADDALRNEIIAKGLPAGISIIWVDSMSSLLMSEADAYFDLKYEADPERTSRLSRLLPCPVFISAVNETLNQTGDDRFIRINSWPGMMNRDFIELHFISENEEKVKSIFKTLGWNYFLTADIEGFITPRIIAMIINEAYYAFEEGVSSKDEIDLAMKAGTNYPYGPFEWAEKIGREKILSLLTSLYKNNKRYQPATGLTDELTNMPFVG